MLYLLMAALFFAILLLAFCIYRLERSRADYEAWTHRPENLPFILKNMLRTVRVEGRWDCLEIMRGDVRQALRTLNDMRHDRSNENLRASKRQLEARH
ncbi:hypothetical protein X994_6634 (plasmid) [Burkholderia pseudomallei]|uniref:hypothetical protein n=1 Tax=Burkholderia pseudomallei TaxID=28450 RepID=UPI00052B04A7|nr:hypothetical protein [Burkholderia pseudomallei]AIV73596.1 hypothetical protein X994_6634 [Burkholderia pseudomallei]